MEPKVIVRGDFNGRGRFQWSAPDPLSFIIDMKSGAEIHLLRAVKYLDRNEALMAADTVEWVEIVRDSDGICVRSSPDIKWVIAGINRRNGDRWAQGELSLLLED
jgi:hypothetical protein